MILPSFTLSPIESRVLSEEISASASGGGVEEISARYTVPGKPSRSLSGLGGALTAWIIRVKKQSINTLGGTYNRSFFEHVGREPNIVHFFSFSQ